VVARVPAGEARRRPGPVAIDLTGATA
jgi:hypothetical protein